MFDSDAARHSTSPVVTRNEAPRLNSARCARDEEGYVPGEQFNDTDIVKLNTNENPCPPSPAGVRAILSAHGTKLRKYPEPLGHTFRKTAGRVLNVDPDAILIGNGSDDILTILTRAFVPEGGLIVSPSPSYSLYRSLAEIQRALSRQSGSRNRGCYRRHGTGAQPHIPGEPELAVGNAGGAKDGRRTGRGRRP